MIRGHGRGVGVVLACAAAVTGAARATSPRRAVDVMRRERAGGTLNATTLDTRGVTDHG